MMVSPSLSALSLAGFTVKYRPRIFQRTSDPRVMMTYSVDGYDHGLSVPFRSGTFAARNSLRSLQRLLVQKANLASDYDMYVARTFDIDLPESQLRHIANNVYGETAFRRALARAVLDGHYTYSAKRMPAGKRDTYWPRRASMVHQMGRSRAALEGEAKVHREMFEAFMRQQARKRQAAEEKQKLSKAERVARKKQGVEHKRAQKHELTHQAGLGIFAGILGGALATLGAIQVSRVSAAWAVAGKEATGLITAIKRQLAALRDSLGSALWYIPIAMILFKIILSGRTSTTDVFMGLGMLLPHIFPKRLCAPLLDIFRNNKSDVQHQSGLQTGVISKVLASVVCFSALGTGVSSRTVSEFAKRLCIIGRLGEGWETFTRWVLSGTQAIINSLRALFGKTRIQLMDKSDAPMRAWQKRVDDSFALHNSGSHTVDASCLTDMVGLVQQGAAFKEIYRASEKAREVDNTFIRASNLLAPYLGALQARNNFRVEPIMAMFHGDSGIGKTTLAPMVCSAVLKLSGILGEGATAEDILANIWQKGVSEFWNSYAAQACMVMDDAFQLRPDPSNPESEFMVMIRAVSTWAFPLNFADLASKGKIFFQSKFIFGTTNVSCVTSDAALCIHEPEAVVRRISHPYHIELNPEFATPGGKLDWPAYEKALEEIAEQVARDPSTPTIDRFPWHVWTVQKHNYGTGVSESQAVPLRDEVLRMATDLKLRCSAHNTTRGVLSSLLATPTPPPPGQVPCPTVAAERDARREMSHALSDDILDMASVSDIQLQSTFHDSVASYQHLSDEDEYFFGLRPSHRARFRKWAANPLLLLASSALFVTLILCVAQLLSKLFGFVWATIRAPFSSPDVDGQAEPDRKPMKHKKVKLDSNGLRSVEMLTESNVPAKLPDRVAKLPMPAPKAGDAVSQSSPHRLADIITTNCYRMVLHGLEAPQQIGTVTLICDSLGMAPRHFTDALRNTAGENLQVSLTPIIEGTKNRSYMISLDAYLKLPRATLSPKEEVSDAEFINFAPVGIRAHRNIITYLVLEARTRHIADQYARLIIAPHVDDANPSATVHYVHLRTFQKLPVGDKLYTRALGYTAETRGGDCGAPITLINTSNGSQVLCGFHIAGSPKDVLGFGALVTREMAESAREALKIVSDNFEEDVASRGIPIHQISSVLLGGEDLSFTVIGKVKPEHANHLPTTSKLYPVPAVFGKFGDRPYAPALLGKAYIERDGEQILIDPMIEALRNFGSQVRVYEHPWLDEVTYVAMREFTRQTKLSTREVFSFDDAVLGFPGQRFRKVPRNTSPGYPLKLWHLNGKTDFFGNGEDYDLTSQHCDELRVRVQHIIDCAKLGIRLGHIFVDFPKDELRTLEKVQTGATRAISSAPLDYVIAWRQYFGAFSLAFMTHNITTGMAPGINPYNDWTRLGCFLSSKGPDIFDGDFKRFDSSEMPTLHLAMLRFINSWYNDGEENARVREVLWLDLIHSRHILRDIVYQWNKSLPSGHPFTTVCNSMYSLIVLCAAFRITTGGRLDFWEHVAPQVFGDDNLLNVSPTVAPVYNQVTVASTLAQEFGLTYTPGRKDGVWTPTTTIDHVTFLKRGFLLEDSAFFAPLELDSFLYINYWCRNALIERKIQGDNAEFGLRELSLHSQAVWDEHLPKLIWMLDRLDKVPIAQPTRATYRAIVHALEDAWY